jgi:CTP:molybdopterin cytidylyltransferase MocA
VRRAAAAARRRGAAPFVVVLGAHADAVAPGARRTDGVTLVRHAGWAEGLASSLAAGVRAADALAPRDGVLVTLGDQPLVDAAALGRLLDAFAGPASVVAAEYAGTVGAPAIVGRDHLDDLLRLSATPGPASGSAPTRSW